MASAVATAACSCAACGTDATCKVPVGTNYLRLCGACLDSLKNKQQQQQQQRIAAPRALVGGHVDVPATANGIVDALYARLMGRASARMNPRLKATFEDWFHEPLINTTFGGLYKQHAQVMLAYMIAHDKRSTPQDSSAMDSLEKIRSLASSLVDTRYAAFANERRGSLVASKMLTADKDVDMFFDLAFDERTSADASQQAAKAMGSARELATTFRAWNGNDALFSDLLMALSSYLSHMFEAARYLAKRSVASDNVEFRLLAINVREAAMRAGQALDRITGII